MPPFILTLLRQGLGLIGNAALAKGKEWVEEKTGVELKQEMPPEDLVKLRQFELENEQELQKLALEDRKIDLEFFQASVGDVQNARQREVEVEKTAVAGGKPWYLPSTITILTFVVVIGGGIIMARSDTNSDIRYAVVAAITMVLTYYYGTSASSARNGQALRDALERTDK